MNYQSPFNTNAFLLALAFVLLPTAAVADLRLTVGPLPQTLVNHSDCTITEPFAWGGFGWDGQQSCLVSNLRLFGAPTPLAGPRGDFSGRNWSNTSIANQTLRCDSYQLRNISGGGQGYSRSRYDFTILVDNTIPATALNENLDGVTAHVFSRGFDTGRSGVFGFENLVNFNATSFTTERGYLFIEDRGQQNANNEFIVDKFAHCWLRYESRPLRATLDCVDFDGDGIGWDGASECMVASADENCDYSNAASGSNAGWGYNPITNQSCPPIGLPTDYMPRDECRRSGDDIWGWNEARQESCRL